MLYEKLRHTVLPQLIPPQTRLLVAVSGGPDSMALCHVLRRYAEEIKMKGDELSLVLTHVNHGVRREADQEEEMVREMARQWGISCVVHRFDAKWYAQTSKQSFETAAREWRYARWKEDMVEHHCSLLATAHHLGDQVETVLYRLLRGSGTAGLGGIHPKKGGIIRPFLTVPKEEILEYCHRENIPYAIDRSNLKPVFVRNRIRLELIPELKKNYNPRIMETIGRTAEVLRWDEEYLTQHVEEAWQKYSIACTREQILLSREIFREPKAILSRLIRKAAAQVTGEPRGINFTYVCTIMASEGQVGWRQNLPGLLISIEYDGVRFTRPLKQTSGETLPETPVRFGTWFELTGFNLLAAILSEDELKTQNPEDSSIVDWADFNQEDFMKMRGGLVFRRRRPGDKLWIQGVGHKSLKKIFQEAHVNADERRSFPLLAHECEILWIPGVRQSDLYRGGARPKVRIILCRKADVEPF